MQRSTRDSRGDCDIEEAVPSPVAVNHQHALPHGETASGIVEL